MRVLLAPPCTAALSTARRVQATRPLPGPSLPRPAAPCPLPARAPPCRGWMVPTLGAPRALAAVAGATPAAATASMMEGFMERVKVCNLREEGQVYSPLEVDGKVAGYLLPAFADKLSAFPDVFVPSGGGLALAPGLATPEARTEAIAGVTSALREEGVIKGWRDELYPVVQAYNEPPLFLLERAAAPHFGIKAYGVHVNGYVTLPGGEKELWVARRSATKQTWPGLLDHIVAGGLPHGISAQDNVVKECEEEASIPEELGRRARPAGAVSYETSVPEGLKRDVLLVYDIELPEDFVPTPCDGEVEEFFRWPLGRVMGTVAGSEEYKPNCNLVVLDFLVRHGCISAELPGYLGLLSALRSGDCS